MQHYHVLKKFNFDLLTPFPGPGGGGGGGGGVGVWGAKYLLPCCCILDSLPKCRGGGGVSVGKIFATMWHVAAFLILFKICNMTMF